ncbi:hypothetical protein L211DRAFT_851866 [Terfezia boudieri ATCC MYA-4762]|uniref:Uncharacterized protein n=1 Tax=Terfezia boudieri ATCC MYA-4762 TaxID=1051890 RepID=A0A3N4LK02_9PEZI|nr:hypothetical protein L211DRAFT_851866 [Terfezia boudieri ATCC MYA-4762]
MSNDQNEPFSLQSKDLELDQEQALELVMHKPICVGPRSRSFFTLPDEYKDLTMRAAMHVRQYTLFQNPFLNALDIGQLLSESWLRVQEESGSELKCIKVSMTYAMRHCLKAWATGIYIDPPVSGDFKYETTVTTIKADIHSRLAATRPNVNQESAQALQIGDPSAYEDELTEELGRNPNAVQQYIDQFEGSEMLASDNEDQYIVKDTPDNEVIELDTELEEQDEDDEDLEC